MRAAKLTRSTNRTTGITWNYVVKDTNWEVHEVDCTFHQFAQEGEDGSNYPVAIIELANGTVHAVGLDAIRFTDKLLSTTGDKEHETLACPPQYA